MQKPHTATQAPVAWEWLIACLLSANLAWTSLCLGGVRAETMVWSTALTGAALAALLLRALLLPRPRPHWAGWCVLPFLLYATANVLWVTPVRWLGERDLWQWFQIFATFWIALNGIHQRRPRQLVLATILLLGVTAIVLAGWQLGENRDWLVLGRTQAAQYTGRASGFFGNPNTLAAFFILLIPPVLACAWQRGAGAVRRVIHGYLAIAFIGAAIATLSRGGLIALALALICWPLLVREWPFRKRALVCASAIFAAALASSVLWFASPAARARIDKLLTDRGENSRVILWRASLQMAADTPLFGTGAGSFNTIFEKYRPEGFRDEPQWTHNDYLNTLADHGIVGVLLLLGGAVLIVWRCRMPPDGGNTKPQIPAEIGRQSGNPKQISTSNTQIPNHQTGAPAPNPKSKIQNPEFLLLLPCDYASQPGFARALGVGLLGLALACMVDFHMKIPAIGMIAAVLLAEFVKRREALALTGTTPPDSGCQMRETPRATGTTPRPRDALRHSATGFLRALWLRRFILIVSTALLALIFHRAITVQRAEAMRVQGREIIDSLASRPIQNPKSKIENFFTPASLLAQADVLFQHALTLDPANAQAWADRAYGLALQAREQHATGASAAQFGRAAEQHARAALAHSDRLPEFWIRLGVALDLQGSSDAGDAFARALQLAPASALAWYHQAYHLSLNPATRPLAQSALNICLRLDPGYQDAEDLRQQITQNH